MEQRLKTASLFWDQLVLPVGSFLEKKGKIALKESWEILEMRLLEELEHVHFNWFHIQQRQRSCSIRPV